MIVRELLPRYISGLTSSETNRDIREHMERCDECRRMYEEMKKDLPGEEKDGSGMTAPSVHPATRLRRHVFRKSAAIALTVCAAVAVFLLTAVNLKIPLTYDANRMQVESQKSVIVPTAAVDEGNAEDGYIIYPLDDLPFSLKKAVMDGRYQPVDLMCFAYSGLNEAWLSSVGRTVVRDGEKVRLVYFCYSKTLWNMIRYGELSGISESGSGYGDMYDDSIADDGTYSPEYTEIYYLEDAGLSKLKEVSDDEYIQKADHSSMIWSGVI